MALVLLASCLCGSRLFAHSGPPFPIVSDLVVGGYEVSVWTDPDATDDGSKGGQFWIVVRQADGREVPPGTRAQLTVRPLDREGPEQSATTVPVDGNEGRQFAAVLMDHEGRFAVKTAISGPAGPATVDAEVDATYDLRPPPILLVVYLVPFVLIGTLWLKLLRRRRAEAPAHRKPQ